MLIQLHPENPFERTINQVVDVLENDGVIIFPTDTVYALACAIDSKKGFERICRIRRIEPKKAIFSMIADSITMASPYLYQLSTPVFRILNRNLPAHTHTHTDRYHNSPIPMIVRIITTNTKTL